VRRDRWHETVRGLLVEADAQVWLAARAALSACPRRRRARRALRRRRGAAPALPAYL